MQTLDLATQPLREVNATLQAQGTGSNATDWEILNPRGAHALAVGLDGPLSVTVRGATGYYTGGMNKHATVHVEGSAGPGVAENMMSGTVLIDGDASQYAGATGRDAGDALGDSLYEARIFVRGTVKSLGADCIEKEMRPEHVEILRDLLARAGMDADPAAFRRYGSARKLYNFDIDNASDY